MVDRFYKAVPVLAHEDKIGGSAIPARPLPPLRPAPPPCGAQRPAKRVGFLARDVFRLRSPKVARLESRRDAAVATEGQAAALGGAPVAAFLATICQPHPAEAGLRVSLRIFRLRLAVGRELKLELVSENQTGSAELTYAVKTAFR